MESESNIQIKKAVFGNFLTPQTLVYLFAGMIAVVVFWMRTKESWDKVNQLEKELETVKESKADQHELKDLDEKVGRQWASWREQHETSIKEVSKIADWMHYQQGFNDASKK
jgi:hypothetical protein